MKERSFPKKEQWLLKNPIVVAAILTIIGNLLIAGFQLKSPDVGVLP